MATKTKRPVEDPLQSNTTWLSAWCVLGLLLSFYTLYVELRHEREKNYRAFCDFNEYASCSRVFLSKYGKGLGLFPASSPFNIPNPVYGLLFYMTQLFVTLFAGRNMVLVSFLVFNSVLVNIGSLWLGYILFFVLEDICVVCISTYVVNFFMLLSTFHRYNQATVLNRTKQD